MFERYTDRARKVLAFAKNEAHRLNHDEINTEHLLLGLVREGKGVASIILKQNNLELAKVREEIENIVKANPQKQPLNNILYSDSAKRVFEYAMNEARNLDHNYVGTEHLLLGLLQSEHNSVAAQVLAKLNINSEIARQATLDLVGKGDKAFNDSGRTETVAPKDVTFQWSVNENSLQGSNQPDIAKTEYRIVSVKTHIGERYLQFKTTHVVKRRIWRKAFGVVPFPGPKIEETQEVWRFVPEKSFACVAGDYLSPENCPTTLPYMRESKFINSFRDLEMDLENFAKKYPNIQVYFDELRKERRAYLYEKSLPPKPTTYL